jgi:hypothetical protein
VSRVSVSSPGSITTRLTSVTPKSLTAGLPPFSTLSSASICWKTTFEVISLKSSGSGGRFHCWSFSVFFVFNASMSCVICSSVFSNWLGPSWLELNGPLTFLTGGPLVVSPFSILSFFAERGDALTRLFEASVRARFAGAIVAGPTIVKNVKACQVNTPSNRQRGVAVLL